MTAGQCKVYELRQYTLHPGTRDEFVRLFETNLLDSQDATGMRVLGQFRDVERPDVFVWLRGFADMERRRASLTDFYYGPVWAAHRDQANAMMIDSDDVLLLEPVDGEQPLGAAVGSRPPAGVAPDGTAEIEVEICPLPRELTSSRLDQHRQHVMPLQQQFGGRPLPPLQTLHAANTFPQLPVHEDRHVAVVLTRYEQPAAAERLRTDPTYLAAVRELDRFASGPVHRLRLRPTPRSALR